jgi:tetraacyldisaccharide 4'-kinase
MRFRDVISGNERSAVAGVVRWLLCFLSWGYGPMIRLRNWLYDHRCLRATRLSVPVICVGNLTAGGTGKTPMVIWLCHQLQAQGKKVVILSRGYQSSQKEGNDENQLIQQALPHIVIIADADRVRGGLLAIKEHQADVLVMDDGFQHRRLARDLDIVMIDATCPFGYEAMLPRGYLREPVGQLKRGDVVVISRSDQVKAEQLFELRGRIMPLAVSNENFLLLESEHRPVSLLDAENKATSLKSIQGRQVFAFCGIGQPESFVKTIIHLGGTVVGQHSFPDHHNYSQEDIDSMAKMAQSRAAQLMVTTQKDWVKISELQNSLPLPLYGLKIEIAMRGNSNALIERINKLIRQQN